MEAVFIINAGLNGIDDRHNGTFTIKDVASLDVKAARCGIAGGYTSRLVVDNSNVKVGSSIRSNIVLSRSFL